MFPRRYRADSGGGATPYGERAAEGLGLADDIGTVEVGKWADLVAVDGDPLQDVTRLQKTERIKLVLKGGTICVDQRTQVPGGQRYWKNR